MSQPPAFDPYHELLGIAPSEQPASLYRLLGVTQFESSPTVIERAADRQMAHLRTFQIGKHQADSQRLLNEISRARQTLLNDTERAAYDAKLKKQLAEKEQAAKPIKVAQALPLPAKPLPVASPVTPVAQPLPLPLAVPLHPAPLHPAPLHPAPLQPAALQPLMAPDPFAMQPASAMNLPLTAPKPRSKLAKQNNTPLVIGGIVGIILIIVAGIGGVLLMQNGSPEKRPIAKQKGPQEQPPAVPKPPVPKPVEPAPPSVPLPAPVTPKPVPEPAPLPTEPPVVPVPEPPKPPDPNPAPTEPSPPANDFAKERAEVAAARVALQSLPKFKKYYDHLAANPESLATNGPKLAAIMQAEIDSNATIRDHAPSHLATLQEVERLASAGGDFKLALPAIDAQVSHSLPLLAPAAALTAKGKLFDAAADVVAKQKSKPADRDALLAAVRDLLPDALVAADVATLAAVVSADAKLSWTSNERLELVQHYLPFAEQEIREEHAATGKLLLEHLEAQLLKSPLGKPRKEALDAITALRDQSRLLSSVQQAKDTLAQQPQDPAANQTLGQYLLMNRGQWRESLPHFAQGSTPEWATLATETIQAKSTADKIALADRWAVVALPGVPGSEGNAPGKEIARQLYQEALADTNLVGINRAAAEEKAKALGPSTVKIATASVTPPPAAAPPVAPRPTVTGIIKTFPDHTAAAISADSRFLATADKEGVLHLWDLPDLREVKDFKGHQGAVVAVAFSANGAQLYSLGYDQTARTWSVPKGTETRSFPVAQKPIRAFVTADGKKWFVVTGTAMFAYDADSGKFLKDWQFGGGNEVSITSVSADGRFATICGQSNTVRVFNLASGQQASLEHGKHTYASTLTADGSLTVTGGGESLVRVWNVAAQKQLLEYRLEGHIYGTALSRDGKRVLGISSNKRIQIWNAKANDEGQFFDAPLGTNVAAFSGDGRYVVASGGSGAVLLALPGSADSPPPAPSTATPAPVLVGKGKELVPNKWTEIQPLIDIDQDLVRGHWLKGKDGSLNVENIAIASRLRLPVVLENCDYDWRSDFRVGADHDDMHFIVPVGNRNVVFSLDSYSGIHSGFTKVKGKPAPGVKGTVAREVIAPNSNHRLEISVRLDGDNAAIKVELDGAPLVECTEPIADFDIDPPTHNLGTRSQPGLMGWETAVTYTSNQFRLVKGNGSIGRDVPLREPIPAKILDLKPTPLTGLPPKVISSHNNLFAVNKGTRNPLLNNKECTEYLFTHAPTTVQFEIPARAKYFTAIAYSARSPDVKFIVRVDGKELHSSAKQAIANVVVEIPAGGKILELECDPLGDVQRDHSCWCFPAFR